MEVLEKLKSEGKFSFLVQYLTVLTDATFDPEYANKVNSAAASSAASSSSGSPYQSLVNKLPELWNFALAKAKDQGLDEKVLDNLHKFLKQVLQTSVSTLGMAREGFKNVIDRHWGSGEKESQAPQ